MRSQAISTKKMWPSPQATSLKTAAQWQRRRRQLFTKALAAELPFPQGICTVPRSASLGCECLREMPCFCLGWLPGRPWKRRFLFWGNPVLSGSQLVSCWSNQLCSWFHQHNLGPFWMNWTFHKGFLHPLSAKALPHVRWDTCNLHPRNVSWASGENKHTNELEANHSNMWA